MKPTALDWLNSRAGGGGGRYSALSTWLRKHVVMASVIILLCSICPRWYVASRLNAREVLRAIPDASTYFGPAKQIASQHQFINGNGQPEISRTPGYPVFISLLLLLLDDDPGELLVMQGLILSIGVVILYLLARLILPPAMAFLGGLLAAVSPWGVSYAVLPLTEGLFVLLLAMILLVIKLIEGRGRAAELIVGGVLIGLLTGAAVLVRPMWPLVILVAGASLVSYGLRRRLAWLLVGSMLLCACVPLYLWRERNWRSAGFAGLTDVPGKTVWRYLASRVKAEAYGQQRVAVRTEARIDEATWNLSVKQADVERWRRARAIFQEYPVLTLYSFVRSATEHAVHPSADALRLAGLSVPGDYWPLGLVWVGMLALACLGLGSRSDVEWDNGEIDHHNLFLIVAICGALTLLSGISWGQGARLRAPLEVAVPLLASVGLVRVIRRNQDHGVLGLSPRGRKVHSGCG